MLMPAGFSDDNSSDNENFDEYPRQGGSIFGNHANKAEEEVAVSANQIFEDAQYLGDPKKETDLAIAKADLAEAVEEAKEGSQVVVERIEEVLY